VAGTTTSSRPGLARPAALLTAAGLVLTGCGSGGTTARPAHTAPPPPSVDFLGDSYTVGVNGTPTSQTYASVLGREQGWRTTVAGYAFAGFVHKDRHGRDYADLFRRELAGRPAPGLLVIAGAHNDRSEPPRLVRVKAAALLAGIHRRWPKTRLVVVGPMWGGDPTKAALRVRDSVRSAARARHVPFVDPLGERWITGHQRKGGHKATGNAARYILPDRTHPTEAGHRYFATRLRADLARLGLPR
jgi:hypothetical protein